MIKLIVFPVLALGSITWQGSWASGCDFLQNDLSSTAAPLDQCGSLCLNIPACTHYSGFQNVCYFKSGPISKDRAFVSNKPGIICGVREERSTPNSSPASLMAFNIRVLINEVDPNNNWVNRKARVKSLFEKYRPDLVGLQECIYLIM
jgi:hypothetical protein